MSLECSECERDLRGGHDEGCSRYVKPCDECVRTECDEECCCECHDAAKAEVVVKIPFKWASESPNEESVRHTLRQYGYFAAADDWDLVVDIQNIFRRTTQP